ncbi:MAG: hypothetical protein ACP5NS_01695 [Candidatus Pacearchaeota archaeon]
MNKSILFLLILLLSTFTSAVQYACPNELQVDSDSEEIAYGEVRSVLSLPIGICESSESSFFKSVESTIFLDAKLITLDSSNKTLGVELISGNKSISYVTTDETQVNLKIESSTADLELGECSDLGGLVVMINSIQNSGSTVEVLVATKKITLNTKEKPSEIVEVNSKKYGVQLLSGSSTESAIKLNKCSTGDIYQLAEEIVVIPQNQTNSTITNNTIIANETITNSTQNDTIIESNVSAQDIIEPKKGFFQKIILWFKNLFS